MHRKYWNRKKLLSLALFGASAALLVSVRRAATQPTAALETVGRISPISVPVQGQGVNNGYPSLLRDHQGNLWCAWVSARQRDAFQSYRADRYEEGDMILLRARKGDSWSDPLILNTNFGVNFEPVLAEDGNGDILAVWSSRRNGEYGLYSRRIGQDLSLGSELRIVPSGKLEGHPSLATDRRGRVWMAAQSFQNGSSDIVFYAREGSGWRRMPDAADSRDPEFRPRLRAAPNGRLWCAWDAYSGGKYRVMVRSFDPEANSWGAPEAVPGDGRLDAYAPDLGIDPAGRVWVTYARNEVEQAAWGLRGPNAGASPRPTVRLVVRDRTAWSYPPPVSSGTPGMVHVGDLPRLAVDAAGAVWVVWQTLNRHVDWKVGAAALQGDRWSAPQLFGQDEDRALDTTPVRADQRASIATSGDGRIWLAYERGRGVFRDRDIFLREVKLAGLPQSAAPGKLTPFTQEDTRPVERALSRAPQRQAVHDVTGERRQLFFGDLHNHLLIDDGHQGSVDQLFVIHRDRYAMDFAATTSHGDSNKLLISELAQNDALTEVLLEPGRFVTIPGFEWTQGDFVIPRAGHRHVLYETPGGPLYRPTEGHSDSIREFVDLMSKTNGLIFAHHITRAFAGGTDWSYVKVQIEPAVEMCSSWGRFEYFQNPGHIRGPEMKNCSVQDAWRMGWRLGVIGGSDGHNLFGDRIQGLTGIYANALTRPALFEALRKRRCYATTGEPIVIDFRVNGHLMGSEISSADGPLIEASVTGTAPLLAVEVIKYAAGQFPSVYRAPIDGNRSKAWWRDPDFSADTFYYVRVTQQVAPELAVRYRAAKDNPFPSEMAWSSPVWVNRKSP